MSDAPQPGVPAADDPQLAAAARIAQREARPTRAQWLGGIAVIIALQALGRIWVLGGRTFYWDDFIIVAGGHDHPWWSPAFWAQPHDGHFAPLAFLLQAAVNALAPWQWWLPATLMVLGQVAVSLMVARAVHAIAGRSWQGLATAAIICWTPLTLPGATWWSAAANALPMQLALAWWVALGVRATVRHDPAATSPRMVARATAVLLVALAFFEKSLAIVPVAGAIAASVAYLERRRVRPSWRRGRPLWLPGLAVTVAWGVLYLVIAARDAREASGEPRTELVLSGLGQVLAALAGGPWQWQRWAPGQAWADAPAALVTTGAVLVLLSAAVAIHRDWRAWAPLAAGFGYLMVVLAAMTWVRSGEGTAAELAKTLHYYGDAAMVIGFALAAAWSDRVHPLPRRSRYLVLALGALLAASSLASVAGYRQAWSDDVTGDWLDTTRAGLAAADPGTPVLNQAVPLEVLLPVVQPRNTYHWVFSDLRDRPPFGRWTDRPRMFDASGRLIDAEVAPVARLRAGGDCATGLTVGPDGTGTLDVGLDEIITIDDWVVEFNAMASSPMEVRLALPNPFQDIDQTYAASTVVPVGAEPRRLWATVGGGGNILRVVVRGAEPGARLCIGAGGVGPLTPAG